MDFISQVSAKASETIQNIKDSEITQKAKNYAGIPGLQIQIGKYESQIRKCYEEIGKAYFEAHEGEEDIEFAEQFAVVKEAKKAIGELKAEIAEKKAGISPDHVAKEGDVNVEKICPICGRSMPEDASFCSVCGHQF